MKRYIALFLVSCLTTLQVASACSTFVAADACGVIVGRNTDSSMAIPGLILVNPRGIPKVAIPWGLLTPTRDAEPAAKWTSRYGSVTVTALGREFPDGGMNEAGLVVEEMSLGQSAYPRYPGRPWISQVQWIQYQLDNFATVDQVLDNLRTLNITGWGWHFTVADASGRCATIDFIKRVPVVSGADARGDCALTNSPHAASVAYASELKPAQEDPPGYNSMARFARELHVLATFRPDGSTSDVQFGFGVLRDVAAPDYTFRSIIHDPRARRIYFRTPKAPQTKYIDLTKLNFSPHARALMLNIDAPLRGDITTKLVPYTTAADRHVIEGFVKLILSKEPAKIDFENELQRARLTESSFVDYLADYSESPGRTPFPASQVPTPADSR